MKKRSKPVPKLFRNDNKSVKSISLKNEKRLSKEIGFNLTVGSGNRPWISQKGDGNKGHFIFECKETDKASISINKVDVLKIVAQARDIGKDPAIVMSAYGLPDGIPKDWVAVPSDVFSYIIDLIDLVDSD